MSDPVPVEPLPRHVRIVLEITGLTNRDGWEWGEAIARSLRDDFIRDGSEFGPVVVECMDVADV